MRKICSIIFIYLLSFNYAFSQDFTTNVNASYLGNGSYQLTPPVMDTYGSIWNNNKIDLSQPFDFAFSMNFGADENGADGMCFVLQNTTFGTSAVGIAGGFMGCGGLAPVYAIEFDIFRSDGMNEPLGLGDHISIFRDGNNNHSSATFLAGPVDVGNLETGTFHNFRITWDPSTNLFNVYMNCSLILSHTYNIIDDVFSGDTSVWWGFSGGCGWLNADQVVGGIESLADTLTICSGDTVQLNATYMPTVSFIWSPMTNIDNVLSMTPNVFPPTSTTYNFTYIDVCGLIRSDSIHINVNPLPVVNLGTDTSICINELLQLDAQNPGSNYLWSPGSDTTQTIDVGTADTYSVIITDLNGCIYNDSIILSIDPLPVSSISGNMNLCYGDTSTLTAYGGDEFLWSTGSTDSSIYVNPVADSIYFVTVTNSVTGCSSTTTDTVFSIALPVPVISGNFVICMFDTTTLIASGGDSYYWNTGYLFDSLTISPLTNTLYSVTVTDTMTTCSAVAEDTVYVNLLPVVSVFGDTAICFGDSTQIIASGADNYLWNTGSIFDSIYVAPVIDSMFIVTGTNSSTSCMNSDTLFIVVHELPVIGISPDTAICEGNSVDLFASGGFSYSWSPVTGLTDPNISDPTATPEFTTTYIVTVTTVFSCIDSANVTVTVNDLPSFSLDGNNVSCNNFADGSVWVASVGGSTPYTYNWNITSTDSLITGLSGGTYSVTATNIYGCVNTASFYINEPAILSDSVIVTDLLCFEDSTGSVSLIISGGTPVYSYSWSNGHTTASITELSAGSFDVTITDNNGCKIIIPEIDVNEPDPLKIFFNTTNTSCYNYTDGSVSTQVIGGTLPYFYNWSSGDNNTTVSNLGAGTYFFTVTDNHNCSEIGDISVTQPELLEIIDSAIVNASCYESGDGYVCINTTGGTEPHVYLWSNNETGACINNLSGGIYTITVTDFNNCVSENSYAITNGTATCLLIPTMFTPNIDGFNDDWDIQGIEYYPEISIEIFNRWGDLVFSYSGAGAEYNSNPWDGTLNGRKKLPLGSYVYILNIKNETTPINGVVSIKR
ncbi:MAG: gliding motility-associated C-terminal domain-containing protein [Bacteroidota bacterium]